MARRRAEGAESVRGGLKGLSACGEVVPGRPAATACCSRPLKTNGGDEACDPIHEGLELDADAEWMGVLAKCVSVVENTLGITPEEAKVVGGGVGSSDIRMSSFMSANRSRSTKRSACTRVVVELLVTGTEGGGSMISTEESSPSR